jgi:hypothetical protein
MFEAVRIRRLKKRPKRSCLVITCSIDFLTAKLFYVQPLSDGGNWGTCRHPSYANRLSRFDASR